MAKYAVVLLSPDDEGFPAGMSDKKRYRARQNAIFELGYFAGSLGRDNLCVLHKGNIELPSDYLGVLYVSVDESGGWKLKLARVMKNAGLAIDLNRLV